MCIRDSINANPPGATTFGADTRPQTNQGLYKASVNMANGPTLTRGHVANMLQTFGGKRSRERKIIATGIQNFGAEQLIGKVKNNLPAKTDKALLDLGQTIGRARGIQAARMGNIAALHKGAAWELGAR